MILHFFFFKSSSQSEDDINEIVYENINSPCRQIDNRILILSDSDSDDDDDQDIDISFSISPTINILISPSLSNSVETLEEEEEEEINIENDHELIDLTEDEPNSTCYSSNKHENQSSIDDEQCPICLETLFDLQSIGVYLIITQCHHVMCTLCSHELLATSSRCPLCRKNISSTTLLPYCILP
jgi:hypothetical protein